MEFVISELRKEKRDLVLSGKRIRFDVDDLQDYDITEAEVKYH